MSSQRHYCARHQLEYQRKVNNKLAPDCPQPPLNRSPSLPDEESPPATMRLYSDKPSKGHFVQNVADHERNMCKSTTAESHLSNLSNCTFDPHKLVETFSVAPNDEEFFALSGMKC